ncbi:hypothetical protein DFP72DRAFT_109455 [Ephemerocybe angulata]|uniref:Secreted protein n=1 Tax=Ephemerocybe angulata TaxID=980116 RepID=A0A8H6LU26_9AGAR|nr:hypothetical protein DFP72DRAFT_109455 [Tulosesus angulatus]
MGALAPEALFLCVVVYVATLGRRSSRVCISLDGLPAWCTSMDLLCFASILVSGEGNAIGLRADHVTIAFVGLEFTSMPRRCSVGISNYWIFYLADLFPFDPVATSTPVVHPPSFRLPLQCTNNSVYSSCLPRASYVRIENEARAPSTLRVMLCSS